MALFRDTPILLPTPRACAWGGRVGPVSEEVRRWIREGIVSGPERYREDGPRGWVVGIDGPGDAVANPRPNPQGYRIGIEISDDVAVPQVNVRAGSPGALRFAFATLSQLVDFYEGHLPACWIEDEPGFATRGVMLDVSRDKVPTMGQFRETIDLLASLKFNHLQLYTEHTFAYKGHEDVWKDCSPLTGEEVRELDGYAAARGIELAANQNCFGHLAAWLRKPAYQHLAEIEGDNAWYFHQWERRGAFSLCPMEPRAEQFVGELLDELLPCFTSKLVNIGCDETFDVGWGRSKHEVDRRVGGQETSAGLASADSSRACAGVRAELYFEFVAKIAKVCEKHGKRPMMWADIALTHPELLHLMPKGMIGLAWWYEPTEKFEKWVEAIKRAGHEAWVCPGTSSWRTFTGRTSERRANIADAAEQGLKAGATGFLVCDWGDMGHRQQWPIALAGLAQAAEAAWNPANAREFDPRATGLHVLNESAEVGEWLDLLGDCDLPIRQSAKVLNASALFNDLHPPVPGQLKGITHEVDATIDQWQEARSRLEELRRSRPEIQSEQLREELDHAVECAIFAADHAIAARDPILGTATRSVAVPKDVLIARCEAIKAEHERLWIQRNRPGGMDHASSFYTKVIHALG